MMGPAGISRAHHALSNRDYPRLHSTAKERFLPRFGTLHRRRRSFALALLGEFDPFRPGFAAMSAERRRCLGPGPASGTIRHVYAGRYVQPSTAMACGFMSHKRRIVVYFTAQTKIATVSKETGPNSRAQEPQAGTQTLLIDESKHGR
jgi:hypothetical protein